MKKIIICIFIMIFSICMFGNIYSNVEAKTYNQSIGDATSSNNNGIDLFPESYQVMLKKLVDSTGHTNWKFRPFYTQIDWNTFYQAEKPCLKNTVYKGHDSSWYCSCNRYGDVGYYCASNEILQYYMDPRNFLTEITIFQFLDLSNTSVVSVETIKRAISGTYLDATVNGEHYANIIYDAAKESGENALSIVVRIFQELGNGSSTPYMISGKDATYPGVYNFFNYGATDGAGNTLRGLAYAQSVGWTSPRTALIEGAKLIARYYTSVGQLNKYLYKFNVVDNDINTLFEHQYMTNIQDPNSQAEILYNQYNNFNLVDGELTFVIPVFNNMPNYIKLPNNENSNGDLYFISTTSMDLAWRTSPELPSNPASNRIGYLPKDTVVTMLELNAGNGFSKVSVNGQVGYMSTSYLTQCYGQTSETKYLGTSKSSSAYINYTVHLQDIGWTSYGQDGSTLGTIGNSRRLEAIKIDLNSSYTNKAIKYRAHVADVGWQSWVTNGNMAGTTGQDKQIEALEIKPNDTTLYTISYRVYVATQGWTSWVTNGETAGTTGQSLPITAVEIKVSISDICSTTGTLYKGSDEKSSTAKISYNVIAKNKGSLGWASDGQTIGSYDQSRQLHGMTISLGDDLKSLGLTYRLHVSDIGWTSWLSDGTVYDMTATGNQIEAIQIKLNGTTYNVVYRTSVQDVGWQGWVKNGETAGTTGLSRRLEAIEIKLEDNMHITYRTHIQDIGWLNNVVNGTTSGTTGLSKRMEAIYISIPVQNNNLLKYRVHVQDIGWMDYVKNSQMAGTTGQSKRIEAIQIDLDPSVGKTLKYRVHIEDIGWTQWYNSGEIAGTTGQSKRLEAIEIKLE